MVQVASGSWTQDQGELVFESPFFGGGDSNPNPNPNPNPKDASASGASSPALLLQLWLRKTLEHGLDMRSGVVIRPNRPWAKDRVCSAFMHKHRIFVFWSEGGTPFPPTPAAGSSLRNILDKCDAALTDMGAPPLPLVNWTVHTPAGRGRGKG